jgi:hypothetical protein
MNDLLALAEAHGLTTAVLSPVIYLDEGRLITLFHGAEKADEENDVSKTQLRDVKMGNGKKNMKKVKVTFYSGGRRTDSNAAT